MSAELTPATMRKLKSAELQARASKASDDSEVVLVEIDIPKPRLTKSKSGSFAIETSMEEEAETQHKIADTQRFLSGLTGSEPTYLSSSQVFITEVNGHQLRDIAQHPLVAAVWPNRKF